MSQKEWTLQITDKQELLENILSLYKGQRSRVSNFHKIEISDFGVCTFEETKEYLTNNGFDDCEFTKLDRDNMVDIRTIEIPDYVPVLDDSNMGRIERCRLETFVKKLLKVREEYEKEH